ncbi:MAG: protease pro-enzyme activation domain-containing protein, partial [Terracidiphilus sp.]
MSRLRALPSIAFLCALCCFPLLRAQAANIAPRVVAPVNESSRITLGGSVSALARPEFDHGEASPATELHNVRLVIQRSRQQETALDNFMAEQLDRHSPNFHHWLTPDQFNKLYGLADSDAAAIKLWLQSHGLKVESVTGTDIAFSGAVPQIEEALHISIHTFVTPSGHQFLSTTTEPSIPAAFSSVIRGVAFLNTIQPRSYAIPGPQGKYDAQTKKLVRTESSTVKPLPDLTTSGPFLYVVPADAATIYDTPNSYNVNFPTSGTTYTGSGVTIGVGGDSAIQTATVVDFRTRFLNGDTTPPTVIDAGAPANPAQVNSDEDEAYLDNETSGGLAPGATIDFYVADQTTAGGISTAIPRMLSDNTVDIFSLSFGYCELYLGTASNQVIAGWWQQAASQGITVVVSTGDSGSAGCDNQDKVTIASLGLNVSGYSTTPYNVAVGGTDFYGLLNGGFSTHVNNNSSSTNSYGSALGYIPESTWNDSTSTNGQISGNVAEINSQSATNIIGGAGGASNCSVNTTTFSNTGVMTAGTCTSGYPKPSWQTGPGVPKDGERDVPDVALLAANGFYGAAWLVCTDDTGSNGANPPVTVTANCTNQTDGNFYFSGIGGTSASTPAFAGILALVVQANKAANGGNGRIGMDGAKFLYEIYNGSSGAAAFHDITQGNNSVLCTSGTPDCTVSVSGGYSFESGYNTGTGYDLATGLGSVDANNLIADYLALPSTGTGTNTPTVTVTPASSSIDVSASLGVTVTVAGVSGVATPTGTVTLSSGTYSSSPATLETSSGSATITIPANSLAVGADTLSASYSGDTNYTTGTATSPVTVTQANSTYSLSASTPAPITPGSSATSTVTASTSNGYAGTVNLSCTLAAGPTGANDVPGCSISTGSPVTLSSSATSATATTIVTTTAATSSSLDRRGLPGWLGAGGGT